MNKNLLCIALSVFSINAMAQNVGVGSATPTSRLEIKGAVDSDTLFQVKTSAGASRLMLLNTGNLGIGTVNPNARLQVASAGNTATDYTARFQSSGSVAGAGGILFDQNSDYSYKLHTQSTSDLTAGSLKFSYINQGSGSTLYDNVLVFKEGRVGIGSDSPASKLQVSANSQIASVVGNTRGILTVEAPYTENNFSTIDFPYSTGGLPNARIAAQFNGSGSSLHFGTSNDYASGITHTSMSISTSGDVAVRSRISTQGSKVVRDFLTWSTTVNGVNTPIHIKTNIAFTDIMYRILVEGYNYGRSSAINSEAVGYAYSATGTILNSQNVNHSGGVLISQYKSSDGFVVIKLDPNGSYYYLGFSVSGWFVNPTPTSGFNISGTVFHQASNL